jgi:uncharacterized membrane protein
MVALALIPSATIVGIAIVAADWELALKALGRWAIEVLIVTFSSGLFWWWYRVGVQKRKSML